MFKIAAVLLLMSLAVSPALARDVVLPRLKPLTKIAIILPKLKAAEPSSKPILVFPSTAGKWPSKDVTVARQACAQMLKGLDMQFTTLEPLGAPNSCGAAAPVLISSIQGVEINPPAEANCAFAESLYHWITTSVKPAALQSFTKQLSGIGNASAYVCRRRNNSASGKMSEHAYANALDIASLKFVDGSTVNIKGDWGGVKKIIGFKSQSGFLGRIRNDACIRFTTVLGPGSDPYHGDHFHIDRAYRKSGYRICK